MLEDKDRIFTNLYGYQPWTLREAMKRGDWDDTKGLMARGQDGIIEEMKTCGLRGRGGLLVGRRLAALAGGKQDQRSDRGAHHQRSR